MKKRFLLCSLAALLSLLNNAIALPIITSVTESGGTSANIARFTGQTFTHPNLGQFTVGLVAEDEYIFTDRLHQMNGADVTLPIPDYLLGGEHVMVANDNKNIAGYSLAITVAEPVKVYILLDNRLGDGNNANPPDLSTSTTWADQGFTAVRNGLNRSGNIDWPDEVGIDEGGDGTGPGQGINNWYSVYVKEVPAGTFTIVQPLPAGHNNFCVIIKRLSSGPSVTAYSGNLAGCRIEITDGMASSLDQSSIKLSFDGTQVNPQTITKSGNKTSIKYKAPSVLPPLSTHTVKIEFSDTSKPPVTNSYSFSYVVAPYATLTATDSVPANLVDKNSSGFYAFIHQASIGDPANPTTLPNTTLRAEAQVRGYLTNAATGQVYNNLVSGGPNFMAEVINWNINAGLGNDIGNFRDTSDIPRPDDAVPGLPGSEDSYNNVAAEIIGYLELKAGVYQFGVNSDDGFRLTCGPQPKSLFGKQLGMFEGGRGSADTLFYVYVQQDGIYPVRLLWYQGNGDANVEFFSVTEDGEKILINDRENENAIISYSSATSSPEPVARLVLPLPGTTNALPSSSVIIELEDSQTAAVDVNSIVLKINGNPVMPGIQKSGNLTKINYTPAQFFDLGATIEANITFTAGGQVYNRTWSFQIRNNINQIPAIYAQPPGSGQERGFTVRVVYTSTYANSTAYSEDALAGLNYAAVGYGFEKPDYIYYNVNAPTAFGNFPGIESRKVPGQEDLGITTQFAMEAVAYLELKRGAYRMGVNSDDGFRVTCGATPQEIGLVLGEFSGGRGFADTMFDFLVPADGIYPFRLTWEQGTGSAGVQWFIEDLNTSVRTLINYPGSPVVAYRYCSTLTQAVTIVEQPASTNVFQNRKPSFSVKAVSGSITNYAVFAYQWQQKSPGSATFENIPGANGPTYTTLDPVSSFDNGTQFRCIVTLLGYPSATSQVATLTVTVDNEPPQVYSIKGSADWKTVKISFNELIDSGSVYAANFSISGLQVLDAIVDDTGTNILLTTSLQTPGTKYEVTIKNITDLAWNHIADNTKVQFTAWIVENGYVIRELYNNITGTTVGALTQSSKFINKRPDSVSALSIPDYQTLGDNYGAKVYGLITAPVTGSYVFYIASDDNSELYLSTDDSPANLSQTPIASVTDWTGYREWTKFTTQRSEPVTLEAGRKYYFVAYQKEGTGGDNLSIAWIRPDDPATNVIPSQYLSGLANPDVAAINIIKQPENITVVENRSATFSVKAEGKSEFGTNILYQWQKNGVDIPNATSASYTVSRIQLADNGAVFRCILKVPGLTTNSADAVVTVLADQTSPTALSAGALINRNEIGIMFDELLDPTSAANVSNYTVAGAIVTKAALRPSGNQVVIVIDKPVVSAITVNYAGIKDLAGNSGAGSVSVAVVDMQAQDIGTKDAQGNFTNPLYPGATYVYGPDIFEVTGGGSDIWGTADACQFVFKTVNGNFDIQARVEDLTRPDAWTKATLMVREDLEANSRNFAILAAPATGQNVINVQWRDAKGGSSASLATALRPTPVPYPNTWLRMQRVDNTFNFYWGTNGTDWTLLYTATPTNPLPSSVNLGLAVTAHINNTNTNAIAQYRQVKISSSAPPVQQPVLKIELMLDNVVVVSWPAAAEGFVLQTADQVDGPYTDVTTGIETSGEVKRYVVTVPSNSRFFRLKK